MLPTTRQIVATIPAGVFTGIDVGTAGYQVSIFSDADDNEGIGNVRPVYSLDCWNGTDIHCPPFIKAFRFGGGAGVWDDTLTSVDTVTADPNAIDIISGTTAQSTALDWTVAAPVVVPYVPIAP